MTNTIMDKANNVLAKIQCLSGNQLKLIAALCMLIDHATKVFYESLAFRVINPGLGAGLININDLQPVHLVYNFLCGIGAVAFPVFAFAFAEGYAHTRSKGRYLCRLLIFAFLSELPFDMTFFYAAAKGTPEWPWYPWQQNVFFTFALALCALWLMDHLQKLKSKPLSVILQGLVAVSICYLAQKVVRCDWFGFGVFLILVAYLLRKNRILQVLGMLLAKLLFNPFYELPSIFFSLALILLYNGKRGKRNMKYFFYGFYPIHIAIIGVLNWLIFYVFWK